MNKITLKGVFTNAKPSHKIKDIEYDQANILVPRKDGKEDLISIKYKKFCNHYNEGDNIEITGNVRSFSQKLNNGKNKVSLYVFTYFDIPEGEEINQFEIDGRICKIEEIRTTKDGKKNLHLILANNLIAKESNQKLNSYLPCIAWGKQAIALSKLNVNDKITIKGELHSRQYKKLLDNNEYEFRLAHELVITEFQQLA